MVSSAPRSITSCNTASRTSAPNAQLKRSRSDAGTRARRPNPTTIGSRNGTATQRASGCRGYLCPERQRQGPEPACQDDQGRTAKTTLKMGCAPAFAGNVACKRGTCRTCPPMPRGGGLDMISTRPAVATTGARVEIHGLGHHREGRRVTGTGVPSYSARASAGPTIEAVRPLLLSRCTAVDVEGRAGDVACIRTGEEGDRAPRSPQPLP